MATNTGKKARRAKQDNATTEPRYMSGFKDIVCKNFAQEDYLDAIRTKPIVFGTGPAGTGKTYLATAFAAEQLYYRKINKLIITRPAVEAAGENLGFLPGELEDKFRPYLIPFLDTLYEKLGKSYVEYLIKEGTIEAVPLGFMRGRSFKNALVILDEAENTNEAQMRLILTRLGENCRILINGDEAQKDIEGPSGLMDAMKKLQHLDEVAIKHFINQDIVRSALCKKIDKAYSDY